jgi:hypothetical protein
LFQFLLDVDQLPQEGIDILPQVGYLVGGSTSEKDGEKSRRQGKPEKQFPSHVVLLFMSETANEIDTRAVLP